MPSETDLLQLYNSRIVREMGVEKITVGILFEVCTYLAECDLIELRDKNRGTPKGRKSTTLMMTPKRVTGPKAIGKNFTVDLRMDLSELDQALTAAFADE